MARAGRPKGSGNKPLKRLLADRIEAKYGSDFSPVLAMIDDALKLKALSDAPEAEAKDHTTSIEAMDKVARYVTPTLKATEISTGDGAITVTRQVKRYDSSANDVDK
jgi:hypothetical protein